MGASRKLQGEIDRVLKKVQEGVDVFDSIWNKVYDTDNANQKEKFEADLKKEIKKLQRYRDQIKTWIQSSEIKDKKVSASYEQALMDARKLIEREMERFKICEKETKTKAFSKEGLGQQPKTDPKEKAKSETRDWLNNVVSELESQIDSFEAEMEGLTVKKGKTRPPRLTHLEASITRHKAHIMKLELILRLLDNDELSPDQVNDVKDFLDDYVERNQEDFEEFSDVDELYISLPLEKVESLEDLVTIPPGLVKVAVTATDQQGSSVQEQVEETASQDSTSDVVPKTPSSKSTTVGASAPTTPTGSHATGTPNTTAHILPGLSTASAIHSGPSPARGLLESAAAAVSSAPISMSVSTKEEEFAGSPGRKSSPALSETGLRGVGRGSLTSPLSTGNPLSSGSTIPSNGALGALAPSASEIAKRNMLGADERLTSTGIVQPLDSPLSNKMMFTQAAEAIDGINMTENGNLGEAAGMSARFFSPVVPGMQWRPGSSFQNQNEAGQFRGRTEIAPDQREKFLQRFQQVQQQGQSTMLGMPPLTGENHKQFSSQQHNPLLQQFNSQSSAASPQVGLGVGVQAPGVNTVTSASLQQQSNPIPQQQSSQQATISTSHKDSETGHAKVEELQQQQTLSDELAVESSPGTGVIKNLMTEDDLKTSYALETPQGGVTGSLAETAQMARDIDLSPGQPLQSTPSSGSLGVIGRRSVSDLGAIGGPSLNSAVMARLSLTRRKAIRRKRIILFTALLKMIASVHWFFQMIVLLGIRVAFRSRYSIFKMERINYVDRLVNQSDSTCIKNLRMNMRTFHKLGSTLESKGCILDSKYMNITEQVVVFLYILAHHEKMSVMSTYFQRSTESISRHVHMVLNGVLRLQEFKHPESIPNDSTDEKWKYFKNCLGALDGTHVRMNVPIEDKPRYRNRKGEITINVLVAVAPNLQFTYVLTGWERSAADGRVLKDALSRKNGLKVPKDAGYTNGEGFLAPYRGQRYHLNDWRDGHQPTCAKEYFNMGHSTARNVVERSFGILKKRWAILRSPSFYPPKIQSRIILVCCVLHNYIRAEMICDPCEFDFDNEAGTNIEHEVVEDNITSIGTTPEWTSFRDNLTDTNFNEWRGSSIR